MYNQKGEFMNNQNVKPEALESSYDPNLERSIEASLEKKIEEIKTEVKDLVESSKEDAYKFSAGGGFVLFGAQALAFSLILMLGSLISYWASALVFGVLFIFIGRYLIKSKKETLRQQNEKLQETINSMKEKFHH